MPPSSSSAAATTAMARPSSRPTPSASKPRKKPPSRSPSPATAPTKPAKTAPDSSARRRSPLSDLNSADASASAARAGCFRFLLSSSSATRSRSRSASTPARTPDPTTKPRRPPDRRRIPDQESRTRTLRCGAAACPEERQSRVAPGPVGARVRRRHDPPPAAKKQVEALTPERKAGSCGTAPVSSGKATPPVHASISPEVAACGTATPACFAAGHRVVPDVGDRRKCRPRGILAIAGDGITGEDLLLDSEPSRASIRWLSSSPLSSSASGRGSRTCSTKRGNGEDEASVNWLLSPRDADGGVGLLEDEIFVPRCSLEDAFWQFSPDCTGLLGGLLDFGTPASELSGTTPSSGGFLSVLKTPSSGDSISPFSLIVKRASASSRVSSLCAQQGMASSYRRGSAADPTPISGESWRESVTVSNGGLTRTGSRSMKVMDPVVECLEMMSLSPRPGDDDYDAIGALPAPLPDLSFQFSGAPTPLESIDLTTFKRSPRDIELKEKEAGFRKPAMAETRISWREGLVSRMFDMGDLDCCKWMSDDEEEPVLSQNAETLPDIKFQPNSDCSVQKEGGDHPSGGGFGSVEFSCIGDELNNNDCKACPKPVTVAESMRAEGFELVSSDDSDWTLFYKNDLFQT